MQPKMSEHMNNHVYRTLLLDRKEKREKKERQNKKNYIIIIINTYINEKH